MWFCIGMYFFLGACARMYFKKKSLFRKWDRLLRQIFLLMMAVTSLAFLSEIVQKTGTENSETMQIKRNGYGEGQKEAALSMQVEGEKKQDIEIQVSPKIYSEKRLEKEFQKAREELVKVISGENKDLSHIKTDLNLVTTLDDFPFSVSWELSRYDVIDSLGRLDQEKIREEDPENQGIGMNITGVLHYEDKVYPCEMDLVIFAGQEKTLSTKERVLELVRSQDSATRQKAYLTLPSSLDGRKIAWTEEKDSKVIPILMLGMAISILLVGREIQKESNRKKTRKEQMMLFINRRGFNSFVSCRACGEAIKCPRCDVALTYHQHTLQATRQLVCHYCGYSMAMPQACPSCKSKMIAGFGTGTEKVEEEIKKLFPQIRTLRMDRDTTMRKDAGARILKQFAEGKADMLIGTQMIVKGHDYSNVTLVGVILADLSLYANDYRAGERTFDLLTQAAGRAGRGE